jgi:pimeloyl-ACP methyl ester carboxylesterase
MQVRRINGRDLGYEVYGTGEPVLLVPGSGARGTIFRAHQVPALVAAGFQAVTVDLRGTRPEDRSDDTFTIDDLVLDLAGVIKTLDAGPCRVVGFSLGAFVVQELLVARSDLVRQAVLMASRARSGALSAALASVELAMLDSGIRLPPRYEAIIRMYLGFSRRTRHDDQMVRSWLDLFEISLENSTPNRGQLEVEQMPDRRADYRRICTDTLVLAFAEDLLTPPQICRELAETIPTATYHEIPGCGHYGYVEEPDLVNSAIIEFFQARSRDAHP